MNNYETQIKNILHNYPNNISLSSKFMNHGSTFDSKYTCDGTNIMLPLYWNTLPNAVSYALLCIDTHIIANKWVHLYIPKLLVQKKNEIKYPNNYPSMENSMVATNSFGKRGYGGPCPPEKSGIHNYYFYIVGLNGIVEESETSCKDIVEFIEMCKSQNIEILGYGVFQGKYEKK